MGYVQFGAIMNKAVMTIHASLKKKKKKKKNKGKDESSLPHLLTSLELGRGRSIQTGVDILVWTAMTLQ